MGLFSFLFKKKNKEEKKKVKPPYYKTSNGETYENTEEYDIHHINSFGWTPLDTNFDNIVTDTPNIFSGFGHGGDGFDGGGASQDWSNSESSSHSSDSSSHSSCHSSDSGSSDGGSSCSSSCSSGCGGGGGD